MSITINGEVTNKINLISGEAKRLSFTFNVPISTASFDFILKSLKSVTHITKTDADFDKSEIASRIVKLNLESDDLDLEVGLYNAQLKTTWNAETSVDITDILKVEIKQSLF